MVTWPEEEIVQQKLAEELHSQEVEEMTELLTSYHNIPQLENALESIFDFDNEEALRKALNEN